MDITLRLETPADYYAVEELTREAFWAFWEDDRQICDEHLLVSKLRHCPSFVPELDYVAESGGEIIGNIIYTKSGIESVSGKTYETLTFGPLSVHPKYQNRGVGKVLMHHSFAEATRLGYRAVIIFGIPDYYPRIGFRRAAEFGITNADGKTFDAHMAYPLYDGALDGLNGKCFADPVYESLTQYDALEFDKRFPPKNKHTPVPVSVLLDRLEPNARAAIEKENYPSLNMIMSKSEREVSSLESIDKMAVETIRATMREHGLRWGAAES